MVEPSAIRRHPTRRTAFPGPARAPFEIQEMTSNSCLKPLLTRLNLIPRRYHTKNSRAFHESLARVEHVWRGKETSSLSVRPSQLKTCKANTYFNKIIFYTHYEMAVKRVVVLVGPKGSGKSHIGKLLDQHTEMSFLSVEPLFMSVQDLNDGYGKVEKAVDGMFQVSDTVVIESLGAGPGFESLKSSLSQKYKMYYIRILTDLDKCLDRVRRRNPEGHIPVPMELVEKYNKLSAQVELDWSATIDNNGPATTEEILRVVQGVVSNEV